MSAYPSLPSGIPNGTCAGSLNSATSTRCPEDAGGAGGSILGRPWGLGDVTLLVGGAGGAFGGGPVGDDGGLTEDCDALFG